MNQEKRLEELKRGRLKARLTQMEAASRLELSQPYLSQLECGRRRLTARIARAMGRLYGLPNTWLPLPEELPKRRSGTRRLTRQLAALGYPGYSHLRASPPLNPAVLVLEALSQDDLDARVTRALPWVLARYPHLNWAWLLHHVKLRNLQNRLGFLASLARALAEERGDQAGSERLRDVASELEKARLAAETTLGHESMPEAEREWLRSNRSDLARRWNVLTDLAEEDPTPRKTPPGEILDRPGWAVWL